MQMRNIVTQNTRKVNKETLQEIYCDGKFFLWAYEKM